jgi:hypothetical protein
MNRRRDLMNDEYYEYCQAYGQHSYDSIDCSRAYLKKLYSGVIKKVVFNRPATIVFWSDGTKTVVKCGEHDIWDPEKGLAMAITKKFFGNKGFYYDILKNLIPEEEQNEN